MKEKGIEFVLILVVLFLSMGLSLPRSEEKEKQLTIIYSNDLRGELESCG